MTFIVGEVSKTWIDGRGISPSLLCQQFEHMIEVNRKRGYRLMQFSLHSVFIQPAQLNETIIAVFEKQNQNMTAAVGTQVPD